MLRPAHHIGIERALCLGRRAGDGALRALAQVAVECAASVWPERCWLCGRATQGSACAEHRLSPGLAGARCCRCATKLAPGIRTGELCRSCRRRRPRFSAVHAAVDYGEGPVREWLLALKHGGRPDLARPLAALIIDSLADRWYAGATQERPHHEDLLVPVPLHPVRWVDRGYDQAKRLADHLDRGGLGRAVPLLRRLRPTPPQGAPEASARRLNVRGAFVARANVPSGVRVWLVDDVLASGATADACARALRRAGAAEVRVLTVARA